MKTTSPVLLISTLLLFSGCGERGDAHLAEVTSSADGAAAIGITVPANGADSSPAGRGSGTLRLGDTTYEFAVRACEFSGETDDRYQTLSGRGTTPEGEQFDVIASRNEVNDMPMHTVSFQTGDVRRGGGTVLEAKRMRHAGRWGATPGEPNEPLIRVTGNRIRAEGRFAPPDPSMAGAPVDGVLEATCLP
jgi:hypothetical protein